MTTAQRYSKNTGRTLPDMVTSSELTLYQQSMLWQADFPASRSVRLDGNVEQKTKGGYGRNSYGSFGSPVRVWFFSKTCRVCGQTMAEIPLEASSGNLPKAGMMHSGHILGLRTQAHRTSVSGSSLWPTPKATNIKESLESWAKRSGLPKSKSMGMPLCLKARMWATPQSFDATDINRSPEALLRAKQKGGCANLREQVKLWATPAARDWRSGKASQATVEGNSRPLNEQVTAQDTGASLNPDWVESLMGYPAGWTDINFPRRPENNTPGNHREQRKFKRTVRQGYRRWAMQLYPK
jgi:hypothetical protein